MHYNTIQQNQNIFPHQDLEIPHYSKYKVNYFRFANIDKT
jgi:hypothetical protein